METVPIREAVVVFESSSFGVNVVALVIVSLFFTFYGVLIVGGAVVYRRSSDTVLRAIAAVAVAVGMALALTGGLRASEIVGPSLFYTLVFVEIGLLSAIIWVVTLADCATGEPSEGNDKVVWVLIILFTNLIGAALYLIVRRPRRPARPAMGRRGVSPP